MGYKYQALARDHGEMLAGMTKAERQSEMIPDVNGSPKVAQLVGYHLQDVVLKGAWAGPVRCIYAALELPGGRPAGAENPVRAAFDRRPDPGAMGTRRTTTWPDREGTTQ